MQGKMADMYTKLQASRNFLYNCTRAADKGHVTNHDAAAVCLFVGEHSTQVALEAIQCLGKLFNSLLIGQKYGWIICEANLRHWAK